MARSVTYVSAAKLVSMARGNHRMAVIDVRDEERSYQAHIAGSHHFASGSFAARLPELVQATSGKDTLVFHCALSQMVGIHTGLPLPSLGEMAAQLLVYFLVEDYLNYWIHRLLHGEWGYEKIHRVHHEYTAPIGFAAPYAHWAEVLILGIPSFAGPAIAPGHMITFWLWIMLRQMEAIETHSGFDFPFSLTKYIPFYGGAEYHDYHHYVGGQSQSNFASVFTYCDYLYGTDRGYRFHKAYLAKLKDLAPSDGEKEDANGFSYTKLD